VIADRPDRIPRMSNYPARFGRSDYLPEWLLSMTLLRGEGSEAGEAGLEARQRGYGGGSGGVGRGGEALTRYAKTWVFLGQSAIDFAFHAFIPAFLGMYLGVYRDLSGTYRQNARDFGIRIVVNSKETFGQAVGGGGGGGGGSGGHCGGHGPAQSQ